jgi:hypothetical protein
LFIRRFFRLSASSALITIILTAALFCYGALSQLAVGKKHSDGSSISTAQQQQLQLRFQQQQKHFIQICCTWGGKLRNGILTYNIFGGNSAAREAVYTAIEDWNIKLTGVKLMETPISGSDAMQPEIEVSIASKAPTFSTSNSGNHVSLGGGPEFLRLAIGGLSLVNFDTSGFITHIKIILYTSTFGSSLGSSRMEQIAQHEIGHALGLGHANFNGDLLSPVTTYQTDKISTCDIHAVLQANQWKLLSVDNLPQISPVDRVNCG